jgi:hypothetical protein
MLVDQLWQFGMGHHRGESRCDDKKLPRAHRAAASSLFTFDNSSELSTTFANCVFTRRASNGIVDLNFFFGFAASLSVPLRKCLMFWQENRLLMP